VTRNANSRRLIGPIAEPPTPPLPLQVPLLLPLVRGSNPWVSVSESLGISPLLTTRSTAKYAGSDDSSESESW